MTDWKVGKVNLIGYQLKIMCVEDAKDIIIDEDERSYQLVLFKKGNAILHINGKSIAVSAPSAFCISDRDHIELISPNSEYEMDLILFHPCVVNHLFTCENVATGDFIEDWTTSVNQDRYMLLPFFERKVPYGGILNVEVDTFSRMLQLFDKIQKQLDGELDFFWPCRSRSYLIELLIILQMRYVDNASPKEFLELNESQKEMDIVLDYIHSNYSNKITIEHLTKQFNMNRNALTKGFMELTGYSPISYLILHRLKVAESLLINTNIPVYEICERVGFGELSNFMKSFKKKYGRTPANYRSLYTTMEVCS